MKKKISVSGFGFYFLREIYWRKSGVKIHGFPGGQKIIKHLFPLFPPKSKEVNRTVVLASAYFTVNCHRLTLYCMYISVQAGNARRGMLTNS